MNILPYLLFLSIFSLDYLSFNLGIIPRYLTLIPELFSVWVLIMLLFLAATNKSVAIKTRYIIFFSIFFLHILIGILLNLVPPGTIIAGLRVYFKCIPFFLLPAVYNFSDKQIENQIKFLLILALFQFPVAIYQKLVESRGVLSGDAVRGTLNTSSTLSIFLVCTIAILLAFFYKKKIRRLTFLAVLFLLFLPTTLNETKGTLILLPIALIVPSCFIPGIKTKIKKMLGVSAVFIVLISIFIPVYDHYMRPRWGHGIIDIYTTREKLENSLLPSTSSHDIYRVGRIDSILFAFTMLSEDPFKLWFGVGIGNASDSFLKGFSGEYAKYAYLIVGAMSNLLWEIGILGVILFLLFCYLAFNDARKICGGEDISGAVALGWTGVVAVLVVSLFYNNYIHRNVIVYLFWYLTGYVAAQRYRSDLLANTTMKLI